VATAKCCGGSTSKKQASLFANYNFNGLFLMCKVSSSYSTINKQNNKPKVNVGRKIHLHLPRVNLYQKQNPWHFNFPKLSLLLKKIFLEHLTLDESLHFGLRSSGGLFTCSYVKNEGFHFSAARANT